MPTVTLQVGKEKSVYTQTDSKAAVHILMYVHTYPKLAAEYRGGKLLLIPACTQ
jgi:hypothetical protein